MEKEIEALSKQIEEAASNAPTQPSAAKAEPVPFVAPAAKGPSPVPKAEAPPQGLPRKKIDPNHGDDLFIEDPWARPQKGKGEVQRDWGKGTDWWGGREWGEAGQ